MLVQTETTSHQCPDLSCRARHRFWKGTRSTHLASFCRSWGFVDRRGQHGIRLNLQSAHDLRATEREAAAKIEEVLPRAAAW